jgi:cysteine-rich repeat protein
MHKRLFSALALALVLLLAPAHSRALSDIQGYEYSSSITLLRDYGIIDGYDDGTFRPNKAINRAEFLKLVMLSVFGDQVYGVQSTRCFTDFVGQEQWYWVYACTAAQLGIIHGNPDGTFRGENTVNLAEALKMSFEAWNSPLERDDPSRPWYERYMNLAAQRGVFRRFPFSPAYQLTRGEMAQLLVQVDEPIAQISGSAGQTSSSNTSQVNFLIPTIGAVCGNGTTEGIEQCDDGNTQNGDGCSSICIIVSEPIRHGALRIEQQPISDSSRASGTEDLVLFAFTAIAGRQDVYITNLKLKSDAGSLAFAEDYRLIIDRDGDGVVETLFGKATRNGEKLNFSNLNILIKDGVYTRIELWADVSNTLSGGGNIAIGFDTDELDVVEGVDKVDGEEVSGVRLNNSSCTLETICWITIHTLSTQTVGISTRGNLFVSEDTSPVSQKQLLASKLSDTLLKLKFRADSENIKVQELAIEGVPGSVDHLEFFTEGTTTSFATARKASCSTGAADKYCMDGEFIVPQSGEKIILVKADINADDLGAVSGENITLSLSDATSGGVAVEAEGFYSGQQLDQNDGDASADGEIFVGTNVVAANGAITAATHKILLAKVLDIENSNTDADDSVVPTGGITFAQFNFSAEDHENNVGGSSAVEITKLEFTVSATNVEFDGAAFYIFNPLNTAITESCTTTGTTGAFTVTCSALDASSVSTYISQNDSIDLGLHGTITSSQASPGVSILQTSLNSLSNPANTGTVEWTDGDTSLGWVDIGKTNVKSTVYRLD